MMTDSMEERRREAASNIQSAFRLFGEARRHLTIWEFQEHIKKHLTELGGQGFVASIGGAIAAGAGAPRAHEQSDTKTEDGDGR